MLLVSIVALAAVVQAAPVFPVAVRYAAEDEAAFGRDLTTIRALGFTAVVVPDNRLELVRAAAAQAELLVIAKRDEDKPPLVLLDPSGPPAALRYRGWTAIRHGARAIVFALDAPSSIRNPGQSPHLRAAGEFAGRVAGSSALFLSIRPIDGARPAVVDARLFESGQALVVIALNHHDAPRVGTIALPAATPLAEWVNIETGEVMYFDRVPDGVALRHKFGARDALVLVIRRDIQ